MTTATQPVQAGIGATSAVPRFHVDRGDGFALCRPDYALGLHTIRSFRDGAPTHDQRCGRNGCARVWRDLVSALDQKSASMAEVSQ